MDTQLRLDLEEWRRLESLTTRASIRRVIENELQRIERELQRGEAPSEGQSKSQELKKGVSPVTKVSNYAWDQNDKCVKFYINISNVHDVSMENIKTKFSAKNLHLHVHNVDGIDYDFEIVGLLHSIVPAESTFKVKKDQVVLVAKKEKEGNSWKYVTVHEQRIKDKHLNPPKTEDEDPGASLMRLMKQMYDEGDDEMKRTISKAWYEASEKKTKSDLMSDD